MALLTSTELSPCCKHNCIFHLNACLATGILNTVLVLSMETRTFLPLAIRITIARMIDRLLVLELLIKHKDFIIFDQRYFMYYINNLILTDPINSKLKYFPTHFATANAKAMFFHQYLWDFVEF